ncbi:alpha/beta hydrolase [Nonomuraea bangladeshensis]|uniref:alpha/beta hydrolase n=1 Tax=Nonomuraea bangladeshensis TaxID=404385 RepID=UPI0031D67295
MPSPPKPRPPRPGVLRAGLTTLIMAAVAWPMIGAARPGAVPAPVPAPVPPLAVSLGDGLAARYAAARAEILAAVRTADRHGHHRRAAALRELAAPARRFLAFDGRDGGRAAEVFGDLPTARRVVVLVPGAGVDLDRYGPLRGGAMRLRDALGDGSAVVAWLGYATPSSVSLAALTPARADAAVPALRAFVRELRVARPAARIWLVCHSYGSVVCGRAAGGLDVTGVVLLGAPGAGVATAAALGPYAEVWAGRAAGDWVALLPHVSVGLPFAAVGLDADPVSPGFGARVLDAGGGGHGDYLAAGSPALASVARIVAGAGDGDG